RRRSPQPVQRREGAERLERRVAIPCLRPAGGLGGLDRATEHQLAVARARKLVAELRQLLGGEIGERRGGLLVVLVLEPGQTVDATEHGREPRGALLPRGGPALLVLVLGADLEEKPHGTPRD